MAREEHGERRPRGMMNSEDEPHARRLWQLRTQLPPSTAAAAAAPQLQIRLQTRGADGAEAVRRGTSPGGPGAGVRGYYQHTSLESFGCLS